MAAGHNNHNIHVHRRLSLKYLFAGLHTFQPRFFHIPRNRTSDLFFLVLHQIQNEIGIRCFGGFQGCKMKRISFEPAHGGVRGAKFITMMQPKGFEAG